MYNLYVITFLQPLMYKQVAKHEKVVDIYSRKLIESNVVTQEDYEVSGSVCVCVCVNTFKEICMTFQRHNMYYIFLQKTFLFTLSQYQYLTVDKYCCICTRVSYRNFFLVGGEGEVCGALPQHPA